MSPSSDPAPPADLTGVEIVVAVSGGIAACKVAELVSRLVQRGAGVTVAMTRAARDFVGPLTFQALTGRRVLTRLWTPDQSSDVEHIRRTDEAALMIVAPATANLLGKIAAGLADDIVTTLVMSAASPVLFAPAMNTRMWENPIVQRNVAALKELGYHFVGPGEGWLACRTRGAGRMAEPAEILTAAESLLLTR